MNLISHLYSKRILAIFLAVTIFIIAVYLRLAYLEHSPIGGDQAVLLNIAVRWVTQGLFPLAANKSSVGLMNPPLLEYLLAWPLFLKRDLLLVAQFISALNIVAIVATYFIVRRLFNLRMALLVTLLYAVNPWSIYYSRLIWNPTPIPFFAALLFGSLAFGLIGKRPQLNLALSFLWLAAIIQLHLGSLVVIPAFAIVLFIFRDRLSHKGLLIGMLLFAISFIPFLVYETSTNFADIAEFLQTGGGEVEVNAASFAISAELTTETGVARTLGNAFDQWRDATTIADDVKRLPPIFFAIGVLTSIAFLWQRRAEFRTRQFKPSTVALTIASLFVTIPLILNIRHTVYLQNYYFLYLYPLIFIFIALPAEVALQWAMRQRQLWQLHTSRAPTKTQSRPASAQALKSAQADFASVLPRFQSPELLRILIPLALLPTLLLLVIALRQLYFNTAGLQLSASNAADRQEIWHVQRVLDTFNTLNARQPECDLIIASDGYNAETSILGQVSEFLYPQHVRYVQLNRGAIIPRVCAFYITASNAASARDWYETNATPLPEFDITLKDNAWRFYEMTLSQRHAWVATHEHDPILGRWDNGAQLRRYEISGDSQNGSSIQLTLTWETYATASQQYNFFNHLLDRNDAFIAQADGPGVYSLYWQPDEYIITWFDIGIPPDAATSDYRLALGMYQWPSLERAHLSDGSDLLRLVP